MRKRNSEASKCYEEKDLADGNNAYPTDPPPATNGKNGKVTPSKKRNRTKQGKFVNRNNNSLFAVPKMQVEIPSKMSRGITLRRQNSKGIRAGTRRKCGKSDRCK